PDPLGQAAVDLALDDHRVDPHAAVVDRDEPPDLDRGGVGVDVDDADVGTAGIGQVGRVVDDLGVEATLHALRHRVAAVRVGVDLLDHRALLGVALDIPTA